MPVVRIFPAISECEASSCEAQAPFLGSFVGSLLCVIIIVVVVVVFVVVFVFVVVVVVHYQSRVPIVEKRSIGVVHFPSHSSC